jgi:alanyl-tRNA synthetase
MAAVASLLKVASDEVVPSLTRIFEHQRNIEKELGRLRQAQLATLINEIDASGGVPKMVAQLDGYPGDQLRQVAQELQRRNRSLVILIGETDDAKVALAVASTGDVDAGSVVKELAPLVGGGGGGSSTLALAGGKDVAGIDELLKAAARFVS